MRIQLADESLRDDLMPNDELREQSSDFLNTLFAVLTDANLTQDNSPDLEPLMIALTDAGLDTGHRAHMPMSGHIVGTLDPSVCQRAPQLRP